MTPRKETNQAKETITRAFSDQENRPVCPRCKGSGHIIYQKDEAAFYGESTPTMLDYVGPCPVCNGGHEQKVEAVHKRANIPASFYSYRMDAFKWDIYQTPDGKEIDTSRSRQFVTSFLDDYKTWEEDGIGLYIWSGMKGSGKTMLASCICNELINRYPMSTRFVCVSDLISIEQSRDRNATEEYERDPIALLCKCKLLVLDDLGQKASGVEWQNDILYRILNNRLHNHLVTLITSNMPLGKLPMDDRTVDRLQRVSQEIILPEYCVRSREGNQVKRKLFTKLGLI